MQQEFKRGNCKSEVINVNYGHTDHIMPIYKNFADVAYHQPIEAALTRYIFEPKSIKMSKKEPDDQSISPLIWDSNNVNMFLKSPNPSIYLFFAFVYTQAGFSQLNKYINDDFRSDDRMLNWQIYVLKLFMCFLPPVDEPVVVYRGIEKPKDTKKEIKLLNDSKSFVSTSASKTTANFFKNGQIDPKALYEEGNGGALFIITLGKGTKFLPMWLFDSGLGNEWELLICSDTKFKLDKQESDIYYFSTISENEVPTIVLGGKRTKRRSRRRNSGRHR
jgi:hypothetical protein